MTWLFEESLMPLVVGSFLTAIAAFAWLKTGIKPILYAAGVFLLITLGLVVLERIVETDREQIARTLDLMARDVMRDDLDAVLDWIHPSAEQTRKIAAQEFPRYEFHHVDIKNNLELDTKSSTPPKEVVATFNVVVIVSDETGNEVRAPRFVTLTLIQDEDVWKVADYKHEGAMVGLRRRQ